MTTKRMRAMAHAVLKAGAEGEAKWNLIFPRGEWHGANLEPIGGSINLDDSVFDEMLANWATAGSPRLPITFHHVDSEFAPGVSPEELKKAAGWYTDLRKTEAGLEGLTTWTPNARQRILADEYAFISPEWTNHGQDRRTGADMGWWLFGAALLNDPFFNSQPKVAAANSAPLTTHPQSGVEPKDSTMNKKMICQWLGMPEDTADEKVMAALESKCKASDTTTEKLTAAVKEGVELVAKPLRETLASTQAQVKALEEHNAKLTAAAFDVEAKALAAELVTAKRLLPAHAEKVVAFAKRTSVAEAREVFGALPTLDIPVGEKGVSGQPETAPADVNTLRAKYESELDAKLKAGVSTIQASRELRKLPEYRPLFAAESKSLRSTTASN